jgi:hypothetical protein
MDDVVGVAWLDSATRAWLPSALARASNTRQFRPVRMAWMSPGAKTALSETGETGERAASGGAGVAAGGSAPMNGGALKAGGRSGACCASAAGANQHKAAAAIPAR